MKSWIKENKLTVLFWIGEALLVYLSFRLFYGMWLDRVHALGPEELQLNEALQTESGKNLFQVFSFYICLVVIMPFMYLSFCLYRFLSWFGKRSLKKEYQQKMEALERGATL